MYQISDQMRLEMLVILGEMKAGGYIKETKRCIAQILCELLELPKIEEPQSKEIK